MKSANVAATLAARPVRAVELSTTTGTERSTVGAVVADAERALAERDAEIEALEAETAEAPFKRAAQKRLAYEVTALVHSPAAAQAAIDASAALFGQGDLASLDAGTIDAALRELPNVTSNQDATIAQLLVDTALVASLSAGRRAIAEGGVYLNNQKIEDELATWASVHDSLLHSKYAVLRRGKKTLAGLFLA